MRFKHIASYLSYSVLTLGICSLPIQTAQAGTIHNNWNYVIDSPSDGTERTGFGFNPTPYRVGGSDNPFEMYGMSLLDLGDRVTVAITGNMPLGGVDDPWGYVNDGNTAWGDLFFNFTGEDIPTANTRENLFAVRFAANNEAGVSELGVYKDITLKNVASINDGWPTVDRYINAVEAKGSDPSMGDIDIRSGYFGEESYNVIDSGTKVGDVELLDLPALTALGLDFENFDAAGSETFGFSFAKPEGFIGSFISHIVTECFNDGVALKGALTLGGPVLPGPTPEPCVVTDGQKNPLLPSFIDDEGWAVFENVESGLWYDPVAEMGFEFQALGETRFTVIEDFPCGISEDDTFDVYVGSKPYRDLGLIKA